MTIIHFQSTTGARVIRLKLTETAVASLDKASAGIRVNRDGSFEFGTTSQGWTVRDDEWVDQGRRSDIGDRFEVLMDAGGSTGPASGPAQNAWHPITSNIQWLWDFPASVPDGTVRIRDITTAGGLHDVQADLTVIVAET